LVGLALAVTILRCWIRLHVEQRLLTIADYLVWGGWICALGWFACSTKALYILVDHPLNEEAITDSVDYLKVSELHHLRLGLPPVALANGHLIADSLRVLLLL
jgi:hypothetical protein